MVSADVIDDCMTMVLALASFSPDPSTQNAACLATEREGAIWGTFAKNEFPFGVRYTDERWERPLKYSYIEHAERNSIYGAARCGIMTEGTTMVCPWAACADCARAIIQAGLVEVVTFDTRSVDEATNIRWKGSCDVATTMLYEAGVVITYIPMSDFAGQVRPVLRDGKLVL